MARKMIGELLVDSGAASQDDVKAALGGQRSWGAGQRLGQVMVSMGKVTPTQVARALSQQFDIPYIELPQIPASVSALVPVDFQSEHRVVPFRLELEGKVERLHVAVADPSNLELVDELRFQLGKPIRVFVAATDDIDEVLAALRGDGVAELDPLEIDEDAPEELIIDRTADLIPPGHFISEPKEIPIDLDALDDAPPPLHPGGTDAPPVLDLPPEWNLFDSGTPAPAASRPTPTQVPAVRTAPASAPVPAVAKPSKATSATTLASSTDLDDLLGGASAIQDPMPPLEPLTRPALPPPPGAAHPRAAQVVKFEAPPKAIPGAIHPAPPPSNVIALAPSPDASEPPKPPIEFSEEDLAILENLEKLASGDEPTLESAKVKPAQMVASLIRLLMKKGVIAEAEFLEELGRK